MDNDINHDKFEHVSSISEEFNEKLKTLKPNIRHEPAPMKILLGVDVPDPKTIPHYTYQFFDDSWSGEPTTITLDRNKNLHSYACKPAWETAGRNAECKQWCKHGKIHRENGPAVIINGEEEYWFEGKQYTKEMFPMCKWIGARLDARRNIAWQQDL